MNIRKYQENEWRTLFELYNRIYTADQVPEEFFLKHLILSPNFFPEDVFFAEENGQVTGAVVAQYARHNLSPWVDLINLTKGQGFLMPPIVSDIETGKRLVAEAEKYFLANGCPKIQVHSMGPTLFPDAVDVSTYPVIGKVLEECGYLTTGHTYSMHRMLNNYKINERVAGKVKAMAEKGIAAKVCEVDDVPGLKRYMTGNHLGWSLTMYDKIHKGEMDQIIIIRNKEEVLGYCQYNYYDEMERVGPFAVNAKMRGQGVGQVMVAKLLEVMAARNLHYAWFASCSEFNASHFYNKNGFEIYRAKENYVKTLEA